ncbi:hypothetical protein KAF25_010453 [Fusarium avenaceum]|uniref:non-specific serine/threonine protein kinase n=1 Tax=Fusarium avenaceum TaxID=40199 RepID=A0A9P7KJQ7_9HYPO|nr:hypothetical protein KAF25_010453 [Fusarium avenaceum]
MRGSSLYLKALSLAFLSIANTQTLPEDLATAIANYSSLSLFRSLIVTAPQALSQSLSDKSSNITVLIPTDDAIKSYLKDSGVSDVTELNQTDLQVFFSYHILSASLASSDFDNPRGLSVPTMLDDSQFNNRSAGPQIQSQFGEDAGGQVVFASKEEKIGKRANEDFTGPTVSLRAGLAQNVKMTAVDGSWGAKNVNSFQVVDKVLQPPRSCSTTVHTVKDSRLDGLNGALIKAELWPALDASRNVTCLAPSTQAFKDAGSPDVALSKQDLAGALLAHTLNEVTYSNYLRDGQVVGTLNNTEVRVSIRGDDIFFNNAKVIEANVLTNNGLIHILDAVIQDGGKPSSTSTGTATKETAGATSSNAETTPTSSTVSPDQGNSGSRMTGVMGSRHDDVLGEIRSQLKNGLEQKNTKEKFATRGMVERVLSPSNLELIYEAWKAMNAEIPADTDQFNAHRFAEEVKGKKLQHFLAVLIYAKCSINAAKEFLDRLVFGNEAEFQEEDPGTLNQSPATPHLLPASKESLERLFSRSSDSGDFFDEQRTFCTLVLGGLELLTIRSNDQISLPWLEPEQIGTGAFGIVYKVTIPEGHLTTDGDFTQPTSGPMTVARKDFICVDTAELSFKKEVKAIRDIFSGQATHDNILRSFGTIVIEGKLSTFSLLMPCADLDLQEYMRRNPVIPPDDTSKRESIVRSARELASALDFLHSKMTTAESEPIVCYHMDLKPSNILIFHDARRRSEASNRDMVWKLSDFGLSRVKTRTRTKADLSNLFRTRLKDQSSQASGTKNFRGTDLYLPVEAELEGRTMNEKSDIWSFGCILSLLFTYMGEGYTAFEGYGNSRLLHSNKNVDYFYQYNKSNIGFELNRGVVKQHEKLIKSAAERSPSEGGAVRYMLNSLETEVLLIDQGNRCDAKRIVKILQTTLEKYSTEERDLTIAENDSKHHSLFQKGKEKVSGFFGRKSKQPLAQTDIRRWRLEADKKLKYKDCVCSPDGSRIAYWTNETITLYDDRSGLANTIPYRRVQSMGSRMSSTDSQRESTLTVAGQYSIADWTTTDKLFNCYIFDVEFDRTLNMYSRVILSYPGIHMLEVHPEENSLACILRDNIGRPLLFTGSIAFDPAPQPVTAASIYSDTARSEHRDAGVCIVKQNAALLELPEGEITCMTLETSNRGYIISRNGSTLSVNVFLIDPLAIKPQHDLNQTSINSNIERLFTDMACLQSNDQSQRFELIIASQAERLFHLRYEGSGSSPMVIIHPPIEAYRILKIATVQHSRKILALGSHSGSDHLFLLNIETRGPEVRPKIKRLADIGISATYQAKLSVCYEGNDVIARIMVDMLEGRYLVFQVDVSNSLGT